MNLARALSSQPSRAPASACAPNRGLIAHHCTYPTPPFSQGTGLIPSSSFTQPLRETAICLLPLLNSHEMNQPQPQLSVLLCQDTLSGCTPLDRLAPYAIPGCLACQPPIPKSTKKHWAEIVN